MRSKAKIIFIVCLTLVSTLSGAQGFLHCDGKNIVNDNGDNVLLRGIGTGNWMLMEGYMMKTANVAGTQHEFRQKLIETIGVEKTDSFFNVWLENHFTRQDVDSMKAWGFNSVRVAMHYKWFTPPIEDEPIAGEITWIEKGFVLIDSLLDWCADNEMYLILDMHGAPGGQGKNASISDYDPSKPSLWESQKNKDKTVALWRKLAERYSNQQWIGGYDLINETNWPFPEGNNSQMRDLFVRITNAIREVDKNHIIYIEGNSFANDHEGLTPPWDDNMAYSFHKYWSGTDEQSLDWIIQLRDRWNVPLWLGESGENSNTWFTDLISLSERKNIGWSWWPVKKDGMNNVLNVHNSEAYDELVKYWEGEVKTKPTEEDTFQAVLEWADNQRFQNCYIQYDVIDAMMRQTHTDEVKPYAKHELLKPIFFTEFDYGKNNIAYFDMVVDNDDMEYNTWNDGGGLRNDGVDIEACTDVEPNNGYNVGWTETGEWMQYSMFSDSLASYSLKIRHASLIGGALHLEVNGIDVSGSMDLPSTGGYKIWQTTTFQNIILPAGKVKLKFVFDRGGSNLNYFTFENPTSVEEIDFVHTSIATSEDGMTVELDVNKDITTQEGDFLISDFNLWVNNNPKTIDSISLSETAAKKLILHVNSGLFSDQTIKLSYNGSSVHSGNQSLSHFEMQTVTKNMPISRRIPGKIQAEDFYINNGFELEDCVDVGKGQNTAFANAGDYLIYKVHVTKTGMFRVIYRVATLKTNAQLVFQVGDLNQFTSLDTMHFESTGAWQTWDIQSSNVYLKEGYYSLRLYVKQSEHNLNWFQLNYSGTPTEELTSPLKVRLFPNPATEMVNIDLSHSNRSGAHIAIYDLGGKQVYARDTIDPMLRVNTAGFKKGIYIVKISSDNSFRSIKFSVQ